MQWFGKKTIAEAQEEAAEALWDASVALGRLADLVDELPQSWGSIKLPGLPAVSLGFVCEHLPAELERLCEEV
jgi:hypothetical protein